MSSMPSRVLYIDLTRRRYWAEERPGLFEESIGGAGAAIRLLEEEVPRGADPLGPENAIVFAVGPFTGLYPIASKTVSMFKSPLTGNLGESHAGGRSAMAIRLSGYGAIVIRGASEIPVYLLIDAKGVRFKDASALWGMRSAYTVGMALKGAEPGSGTRTIMRIGRAGENLVRYACVVTETYRHFGRLGLGAVFGSKRLKAIVISGKGEVPVKDPPLYREIYDEIFDLAVKSEAMKKYHDLGTPMNVLPLNEMGAFPVRNLRASRSEMAESISGERLAEAMLGRRVSCSHCPVACIHLAALREPYEDEPYFYKTTFVSYDYEPLYALGAMLSIWEVNPLLKLIDEVDKLALDAISTGVALAWATEAAERGIIGERETLVRLTWGDASGYVEAVRNIVRQPNEFYRLLASGVEAASSVYGGREFACAFGSVEGAGYHTGPAYYAGLFIGARHSHLDCAGYSYDQKLTDLPSPRELARMLMGEEIWRQVLSNLVVCYFARGIYTPEVVARAFKPLGVELGEQELKRIGEETYARKHAFKLREGFNLKGLRIPRRILEVATPHGTISEDYLRECIAEADRKLQQLLVDHKLEQSTQTPHA